MFYEKAVGAWRDESDYGRVQLVVQYFQSVDGFTQPEIIKKSPPASSSASQKDEELGWLLRLAGLVSSGSDPFYAVLAYKNFKPVYED